MITSPGGGLTASRTVAGAATGEAERVLGHPAAPLSLAEAGLSLDLVLQLVLKTLHLSGDLDRHRAGRRLGLRFPVIEPALAELRDARHVEVVERVDARPVVLRATASSTPAGPGRCCSCSRTTTSASRRCRWPNTPPTCARTRRRVPRSATRERVREACRHLVLSDRVIDSLGPAVNAGHSLFVYGPPGNGKTVIAQSIRNLLDGDVAVPHAIEVEGPDHPRLRSGRARADRDAGERLADRGRAGRGSPLGALPAAARDGRRRADARRARADLPAGRRASTAPRCRRWPTAACW